MGENESGDIRTQGASLMTLVGAKIGCQYLLCIPVQQHSGKPHPTVFPGMIRIVGYKFFKIGDRLS